MPLDYCTNHVIIISSISTVCIAYLQNQTLVAYLFPYELKMCYILIVTGAYRTLVYSKGKLTHYLHFAGNKATKHRFKKTPIYMYSLSLKNRFNLETLLADLATNLILFAFCMQFLLAVVDFFYMFIVSSYVLVFVWFNSVSVTYIIILSYF